MADIDAFARKMQCHNLETNSLRWAIFHRFICVGRNTVYIWFD